MPFLPRSKPLYWTYHAHDKMRHYGLSEARVKRVLHSPKRVEEGVAPKTVAMMQPVSIRRIETAPMKIGAPSRGGNRPAFAKASAGREETWTQEIWVMVQDKGGKRKVISAWRYPGKTKPRSEIALSLMKQAYNEYTKGKE